jgi:hypothetical protein
MRLICVYSALAAAGWLSLDVLFVIAWARLRAAERRSYRPVKATVLEFRPINAVRFQSNAQRVASQQPQIRYGN